MVINIYQYLLDRIIVLAPKGQIKPKADWPAVDSPKKPRNAFVLFDFLLFTENKTNYSPKKPRNAFVLFAFFAFHRKQNKLLPQKAKERICFVCFFAFHRKQNKLFSQKAKERICFVCFFAFHSKQNKYVPWLFGRIICFVFCEKQKIKQNKYVLGLFGRIYWASICFGFIWPLEYLILKVLAWEICNVELEFAKKIIIQSQIIITFYVWFKFFWNRQTLHSVLDQI